MIQIWRIFFFFNSNVTTYALTSFLSFLIGPLGDYDDDDDDVCCICVFLQGSMRRIATVSTVQAKTAGLQV